MFDRYTDEAGSIASISIVTSTRQDHNMHSRDRLGARGAKAQAGPGVRNLGL